MSDFKITGNPNPVVGKEEFYTINAFFGSLLPNPLMPKSSFGPPVSWTIHVLENGKWRKTKENDKTGDKVSYTFLQKSLERKGIRILAKRGEEVARLDIKTQAAGSPKIDSVELLDKSGKKPAQPLSYGQTLKARVHCLHMEKRKVYVTLWEDDAKKGGHNTANEKNIIETRFGIVKNGKADVDFPLRPSFAKIATKAGPEKDKIHEYYVTTEFNKQKIPSNNVDVNELEAPVAPFKGKTTSPVQTQPVKNNVPVQKPKTPTVPTQTKVKGVINSVNITDANGNKIKGIFKENRIKVWINSKGLIGKEVRLKLYDEDVVSDDELLDQKFTIQSDLHVRLVPLDTIPRSLGGDFGEGSELELFAYVEVLSSGVNKPSGIVNVDATVFKPDPIEPSSSVMKQGKNDKKDEKKDDKKGKCLNCEKDITLKNIEDIFGVYTKHKSARQEIVKYINEFIKLSRKKGKPIHLDTCLRKAHFFAQVGTETLGINPDWMVETDAKRYTVANCKRVFGDRAKYLERAGLLDSYCNDNPQKRLLNYVYGKGNGFDNGNGNEASGDGYKFRGRGLKQITGRDNYKDAAKILKDVFPEYFIDLEANPDKVKEPKYAVLTAFAYWEKHEIWKVADSLKESTDSNIKKIRGKVNPGLAGWKECKMHFEKGIEVFKVNQCQPTTVSESKEDNGKWRFPIDNPMLCMYSQGGGHKPWHGSFGKNIRDGSVNHTGNDLLAKPETKVYACVRGEVHKIYTSSSMAGNVVVLKVLDVETFKSMRNDSYVPKYKSKGEILENEFDQNATIYLTFWHLSKNNFYKEGDEVKYNDVIGLTGISGNNGSNFTTRNPHLHFEVSNVGSAAGLKGKCNPSVYFKFKTEDELSQKEIDFQNKLKEKEWK